MEGLERSKSFSIVDVKGIFGVHYRQIRTVLQEDLFLTGFGIPFLENLLPENLFSDRDWMRQNSVRLKGSSTCYRLKTRCIRGRQKEVVMKWNRMGQHVPIYDMDGAGVDFEFNSPFEEFALVEELRNTKHESPGVLYTHKPLAIFVPNERKDLDRLGRVAHKMLPLMEKHQELELDMFRPYAVIYEWIKGIDLVEACDRGLVTTGEMEALTLGAEKRVQEKGFVVHDRKPHHIIVRPDSSGSLERDRSGEVLFALVDFELLKRSPEREEAIRTGKRKIYFEKKMSRFSASAAQFPEHLKRVNIQDVDYVHGSVSITRGKLWVVGRSPHLFDYFLPERWEVTPKVKLRVSREVYYTQTRDNIHIIWRISNMGSMPDMDPFDPVEKRVLAYGFNSPFEEISLALHLRSQGVSTISPLAVYMTGDKVEMADFLFDESRYRRYAQILNPDGTPLLRTDRAYITLWGDWNRPDYESGEKDGCFSQRLSALHAYRKKLIDEEEYVHLMDLVKRRLFKVGVEDLCLNGGHFLVALDRAGALIRDAEGTPEIRICYFELLRRM
jgi:hypothetical protein